MQQVMLWRCEGKEKGFKPQYKPRRVQAASSGVCPSSTASLEPSPAARAQLPAEGTKALPGKANKGMHGSACWHLEPCRSCLPKLRSHFCHHLQVNPSQGGSSLGLFQAIGMIFGRTPLRTSKEGQRGRKSGRKNKPNRSREIPEPHTLKRRKQIQVARMGSQGKQQLHFV